MAAPDRTAGREPRRPYDREALLAVAAEVFHERGFDGTSMEELSRRLGIGKSSIYHHVESKDALLGLALDRALDGLADVAEQVRALDAPAVERLERFLRASVLLLAAELPYVTLLLRVRGNTDVERRALARRRETDRLVASLVADAAAQGDLRDDLDPAMTARLLFGTVNSLVEWYRPAGRRGAEEVADHVVTLLMQGLRRPGGASRDGAAPGGQAS